MRTDGSQTAGRGLRPRPRRLLAAAGAAAVLVTPWVLVSSAQAQACASFDAVAAAEGARATASAPGFLIVEQVAAGTPAAQATADSAGISTAYAGYPYPGDVVLSVPPLAGIPQSTYPLTVRSSYPADPEAELDTPALALRATSEERSSSAEGRGGVQADDGSAAALSGATASASCAEDGTVTAVAESVIEGVGVGDGVLRIGSIRSIAQVVVQPDGSPEVSSRLAVTGVSVSGQTVGFDDGGLVFGESANPLAENPLVEALAEAGIEVSYLAGDAEEGSVLAPAVQIRLSGPALGTGPTVVTYTVGRAFASASMQPLPEAADDDGFGFGGFEQPPATAESPPDAGSAAPDFDESFADAGTTPTSPAADGDFMTPSESAAPPVDEASSRPFRPSGAVTGFSVGGLYIAIVGGGAALFAGAQGVRILGVRLGWI